MGTAVAISVALALAGPAAAVDPPKPALDQDGKVKIHFEDVDLPVFVNFISKLTGRNFVFSEKITGTVTISGGTGRFTSASGTLAVNGTADNVSGTGSSRYDGWIDYDASDRGQR